MLVCRPGLSAHDGVIVSGRVPLGPPSREPLILDVSGYPVEAFMLTKYDYSGTIVWTTNLPWPGGSLDNCGIQERGCGMVISDGRLYLAATIAWGLPETYIPHSFVGVWDAATGALLDQEQIGSDLAGMPQVMWLAANDSGEVLVGGSVSESGPPYGSSVFVESFQWTEP